MQTPTPEGNCGCDIAVQSWQVRLSEHDSTQGGRHSPSCVKLKAIQTNPGGHTLLISLDIMQETIFPSVSLVVEFVELSLILTLVVVISTEDVEDEESSELLESPEVATKIISVQLDKPIINDKM